MPLADAANPLLPAGYDVVWSIVAILAVALTVTALVSIARAREVTGLRAVAWIVLVVAVPAAGALLWFGVGRRAGAADPATTR